MQTVETGEGLPNANSYVGLAEADQYFADRNRVSWAQADEASRSGALIRATDYIDSHYSFGEPLTASQALAWPQTDNPTVPAVLRKAVMELALIALARDIFAPATPAITETERKLGSMSTKTVYAETVEADPFEAVTAILSRIARPRFAAAAEVRLLP